MWSLRRLYLLTWLGFVLTPGGQAPLTAARQIFRSEDLRDSFERSDHTDLYTVKRDRDDSWSRQRAVTSTQRLARSKKEKRAAAAAKESELVSFVRQAQSEFHQEAGGSEVKEQAQFESEGQRPIADQLQLAMKKLEYLEPKVTSSGGLTSKQIDLAQEREKLAIQASAAAEQALVEAKKSSKEREHRSREARDARKAVAAAKQMVLDMVELERERIQEEEERAERERKEEMQRIEQEKLAQQEAKLKAIMDEYQIALAERAKHEEQMRRKKEQEAFDALSPLEKQLLKMDASRKNATLHVKESLVPLLDGYTETIQRVATTELSAAMHEQAATMEQADSERKHNLYDTQKNLHKQFEGFAEAVEGIDALRRVEAARVNDKLQQFFSANFTEVAHAVTGLADRQQTDTLGRLPDMEVAILRDEELPVEDWMVQHLGSAMEELRPQEEARVAAKVQPIKQAVESLKERVNTDWDKRTELMKEEWDNKLKTKLRKALPPLEIERVDRSRLKTKVSYEVPRVHIELAPPKVKEWA